MVDSFRKYDHRRAVAPSSHIRGRLASGARRAIPRRDVARRDDLLVGHGYRVVIPRGGYERPRSPATEWTSFAGGIATRCVARWPPASVASTLTMTALRFGMLTEPQLHRRCRQRQDELVIDEDLDMGELNVELNSYDAPKIREKITRSARVAISIHRAHRTRDSIPFRRDK